MKLNDEQIKLAVRILHDCIIFKLNGSHEKRYQQVAELLAVHDAEIEERVRRETLKETINVGCSTT